MSDVIADRLAQLRVENPASWVVLMLAKQFPLRSLDRDAEMMRLIDVVLEDARAASRPGLAG